MAKNVEVGMIIKAGGNKEAQKEIENIQKNIDNLRKKVIDLNKEFKEKQSLKYNTKEVEQKLKDVNKQLGDEKKLMGLLSEEAKKLNEEVKKTPEHLKKMSDQATIQNLKELQTDFSAISEKLKSLGQDLINEAVSLSKFENIIKNSSNSAKEAKESIDFLRESSINIPAFDVRSYEEAGATFSKFRKNIQETGLDLKTFIPLVTDTAKHFGTTLPETSEVVAKSLSGVRGGIMALSSQFGITKEELKKYGAAMTKAGEVDKDSIKTKQAVIAILKEFEGTAAKSVDGYAAQVNKFNNQVTILKANIGKQLLPDVISLTKALNDAVGLLNKVGEEGTSAAADFIKLSGGAIIAATSIAGAALKLKEFQMAMEAAKLGSLATVGIIGGVAIGIGFLANEYIKAWGRMEEQKSRKIEEETKKIAGGFKTVKDAIDLVNKTPVEIALDPKLEEKIASLEERIKGIREVAAGNLDAGGKTFTFELADNPLDRNNDMVSSYTKNYSDAMDFLLQKQGQLNEKLKDATLPAEQAQKYKAKLAEVNLELKRLYELLEKENPGMYKRQIEALEGSLTKAKEGKTIADGEKAGKDFYEGFNKAKEDAQKNSDDVRKKSGLELGGIEDKELAHKFTYQKDLIKANRQDWEDYLSWLESLKGKFKINSDQDLAIEVEMQEARDRIAQNNKKITDEADRAAKEQSAKAKQNQKEWEQSQKEKARAEEEAWKKTIQTQADTLEAEGKTVESKKLLLKIKEKDLRDSGVAEAEIVKWKEAQIKSIEEEGLKEAKKRAEEKLKANQEVDEAISGISESATEKQISSIKKQAEEWQKSGADRIKTEEYTTKSIQKLQDETFQDFKQKEEQKRKEIEDTAKTIQSIDEKIAANKQKMKDLESGSSFGTGSPLMSMEEALSKPFSNHVDPYAEKLEQSKALEQENQALMSERDKAFKKEQDQQSELKKIQDERNKAQDAFNTALQGTVDKYSAVSKSSPWDAEKAKIDAATEAAKEYNKTASGGGGSSEKKGGSGGSSNSGSGNEFGPNFSKLDSQGKTEELNRQYAAKSKEFAGDAEKLAGLDEWYNYYKGQFTSSPVSATDTAIGMMNNSGNSINIGGSFGQAGFDNPVNDAKAFKAMENLTSDFAIPIVTKSMKDMVTNMLGGMVSSVSNILNSPSYNTTNSQVSNYKSMTNITNYNTTLDNKQISTITPIERDINNINAIVVKFRKPK